MSRHAIVAVTVVILASCTTSRSTSGSTTSSSSSSSPATSTTTTSVATSTTAPATSPPTTAPSTTPPAPSTTPPAPSTTSRPTTTKPTTSKPPTSPPTTAADGSCRTADVSLSLGASDGGAGQLFQPLVLTNTGSRSCTVQGFPRVVLLDAGGAPIGDPAGQEDTTPPAAITLDPGEIASALLRTTNGPIGGPCLPPSAGISVVLPGDTNDLFVAAAYTACGGFTVRAFVAGPAGI